MKKIVPTHISALIDQYGASRADNDGKSGRRMGDLIRALREWASEPDALDADVKAAVAMMAGGEYAEGFAKTKLGKHLESNLTDLHDELNGRCEELDRLQDRFNKLQHKHKKLKRKHEKAEAQLDAIGAGGVEPLRRGNDDAR